MKSGNKPGFKQMGATEAIKQVDTTKAAKGKGSEREIYKAKLRGDYMDLTGDKLKKASYDDPSGTVVSRDPHYLDSPAKQKDFNKTGSKASTTPGYSTTKAATKLPKNFNATGSSKAGKFAKVTKKPTSTLSRVTKAFKNTPKQLAKGGKEILKTTKRNLISGGKQIFKGVGSKTLGTLGMLQATSSKADQPKKGKGKTKYPGGKIDFTKKK